VSLSQYALNMWYFEIGTEYTRQLTHVLKSKGGGANAGRVVPVGREAYKSSIRG
jgi:hypothetical protein